MKFIAGILIGLALASVFFLNRSQDIPEKTKSEFQHFSVNEAKKFAEAKTPDEKLKAAEELYGKMMILFLADLGLHLEKSRPVELSLPEKIAVKNTELAASSSLPAAVSPILECAPCETHEVTKKKEAKKNISVPDKYMSTPYFAKMMPQLKKILGTFGGNLRFIAGKNQGQVHTVLFVTDLKQEGESSALKGEVQVLMTDENGKTYSRNVGKGGNKSIRYSPQDDMIYVEASPVSFFAFKNSAFTENYARGEYYDENVLVGRVLLSRQ